MDRMMPEVMLKARTEDIGQWVQDCADGNLKFDELCRRVAAKGFKTTSLYGMVCAAEAAK